MIVDYDTLHKKWIYDHQEYNSPTNQLRQNILRSIISGLVGQTQNKNRGFTVLDAGCGTGNYSISLAKMGLSVTGFDLSEYAIKTAQEKCENLHITTAHFFVDNVSTFNQISEYDLIVLSEVLEHLDNDLDIVKKYTGFLKNEGHLLFSVPYDCALWSSEDVLAGHLRRYDNERIQTLLDNAGLCTVESVCYGFPMIKLMWQIKIWLLRSGFLKNRPEKKTAYIGLFRIISRIMVLIDSHFLTSGKGVGIIVLAKKKN